MGPRAWGQGFPHSLCFSSSLKYLCCLLPKSCLTLATPWTVVHQAPLSRGFDNSIWCTFPVLFCRCKPPPLLQPVEGANYLMTLSPYTQAFWNLKTDKVNPCDPTLLPHHQPVRELCTSWSHTLWPPLPPHLAFESLLHAKLLQSCPTLCNPMDCALQAPLSMGFSRQEYWSGLPCPPPGDLPNPGIEPASFTSLKHKVLYCWATPKSPLPKCFGELGAF